MRRTAFAVVLTLAFAATAVAGTESKWKVTRGTSDAGAITLLTSGPSSRAEWKKDAQALPVIFIRANGKTWVRASGGDIEASEYKGGDEKAFVPALLAADANGQTSVKAVSGGATFTMTRQSTRSSSADASNFVVRPKKGAASRLAQISGNLLGPSSSGVSATAGGRGATGAGLKMDSVGNYDALASLENRDSSWKKNLDKALTEFQKEGKVGKERQQ